MTNSFREKLSGGTKTSVGSADEVIQELITCSDELTTIYELFLDEDPVVVMRSSYVAMRVAEQQPETVVPFTEFLFANLDQFTQQEVRWHVPQLLGHLNLTREQKRRAYDVLMMWTETDKSKIVGYYCLQTAADIAQTDETLLDDFVPRLKAAHHSGSKSIQNRCKKIAKQLSIDL
jgi:hypothetical protein